MSGGQDADALGLLDTCVVIELNNGSLDIDQLPPEQVISSITLGELSIGPLLAQTPRERAARQLCLQTTESLFAEGGVLPYDAAAARAFGRVVADVVAAGRRHRGTISDLQIAAIAVSNDLPLYTINPADFAGIDRLRLVPIAVAAG